jgi:hypothetical protein
MSIPMKCCHRDHKGETWALDLGEERAALRDAAGAVRGEFTREEAARQFLMPSFSESIKQFRIPVDGQLWYFDVAKPDLAQIKAYIDQSVVAAGPDAVRAVRSAAIRDGAIGALAVAAGVGITVFSLMRAENDPEGGMYFVMYGPILVGLVMLGKSVAGFLRYTKLKAHADAAPAS